MTFYLDTSVWISGILGCTKIKYNVNTNKIAFKVVQIKFSEMHIANQKICYDIAYLGLGIYKYILMEHNLYVIY